MKLKRNVSSFCLFAFLISGEVANAETLNSITYPDAVISRVTSVYDGDTFRGDIEGYPRIVGYRMAIRINGIDTPEIKSHCPYEKQMALKAKALTKSMLMSGKRIELRNIRRGKYFRLLADVYVDGQSVSKQLIASGLAVEYHGKTKMNWCKDNLK